MKVAVKSKRCLCDGKSHDFIKSHVLSPDGYSALIVSDSNYITHWLLPEKLIHQNLFYTSDEINPLNDQEDGMNDKDFILNNVYEIGESIYDCLWYPYSHQSNPSTQCFVTTSRDHPIHLWNINGTIRCSYLGYNHLDEMEAAITLSFNQFGDKLYAGYNRMIKCFDLSNPGRQILSIPTSLTKHDSTGQKGLISSLSFNPLHPGVYAAGSYDIHSGVYLYQENSKKFVNCLYGSQEKCGVTCLKWSPCGNYLWVGGRNNSIISCYDIRSSNNEIGSISRPLSTNQRMSFSLDPWGKYLATGTQDGKLKIFDTLTFEEIYSSQISNSCVNSVTFHPYSSLLFISSGERVFHLQNVLEDDEESEEETETGGSGPGKNSEIFLCKYDRPDALPPLPSSSCSSSSS